MCIYYDLQFCVFIRFLRIQMSMSLHLHPSLVPFLGVFSFCSFVCFLFKFVCFYFILLYFILFYHSLYAFLFSKGKLKGGKSEQERKWEELGEAEKRPPLEYNVWKTVIWNKKKLYFDNFIHLHFYHFYLISLSPAGVLLSLFYCHVFCLFT